MPSAFHSHPIPHSDMEDPLHANWMRYCLTLAAHGNSLVSPNPRVGAVVVGPSGLSLGEGWHTRFGGDHAEHIALGDALESHGPAALESATLFVNLEPCCHVGKTPPCTTSILQHGIPHVVAGMADPNPKAGGGAEFLRTQGVEVTVGVLEDDCRRLNEAFLHGLRSSRPLVTLKIAQTLDGRVATSTGHSQWITGPEARRLAHEWRADSDGILVGSGTALADNPSLNVRHVQGPNPRRFVLDRRGTLPADLKLFSDGMPTTVVLGPSATPAYEARLLANGGAVIRTPERGGHLDLAALLDQLAVQSLMVEAGPSLASALLRQDLVDRLFVFSAPKMLGSGMSAIDGLKVDSLDDALSFAEHRWELVGQDILLRGYLRAV